MNNLVKNSQKLFFLEKGGGGSKGSQTSEISYVLGLDSGICEGPEWSEKKLNLAIRRVSQGCQPRENFMFWP